MIGQSIAKYHLTKNNEVYIFDNKSNPFNDYSNLSGIDVSNIPLNELLSNYKFDIISHQAASVGVGESQYRIKKYVDNNLLFTAELLDSILEVKKFPKKLILASSMGPYGEGLFYCNTHGERIIKKQRDTLSINDKCCNNMYPIYNYEDIERIPQSIYGVTKMAQEEIFRVFSQTYNVPTIALRYFSVYSDNCNPNNPYTGVLSIIANKIINNIVVDLNEDGEQTRNLIHCDDIAELHYLCCNTDLQVTFDYFNVASKFSYKLKDIAEIMIKKLSSNHKLSFNNKVRKGDIKYSFADINKVKNTFNWEPKIELNTSITNYCNFILENLDKFKTKEDSTQIEQEKLNSLNLLK